MCFICRHWKNKTSTKDCPDFNKSHSVTCPASFGRGPNPSMRSNVSICEYGRPQEDILKFYSCVNLECPCLQNTSNHTVSLGRVSVILLKHHKHLLRYSQQLLNKEHSIAAMSKINSSLTSLQARTQFSQMTPVKPLCCTDLNQVRIKLTTEFPHYQSVPFLFMINFSSLVIGKICFEVTKCLDRAVL